MTPPVPPPSEENHQRDALDLSYGGLNVIARGSIVVLVILLAGNGLFTLLTYAWLNQRIEAVVDPQNKVLDDITTMINRYRGAAESDIRLLQNQIVLNRDYLREIGRTCLLTDAQKIKFQSNLSSSMKELLMRDYLDERTPGSR